MKEPIKFKPGGQKFMWKQICEAYEKQLPIVGKICGIKRGALEVDLGTDIKGVAYYSKIRFRRNGIHKNEINNSLLGKQMAFIIEKPSLSAIRLSRHPIILEEINKEFKTLQENIEVDGEIVSIQSYGVFVKFGLQTGLLHRDYIPNSLSPKKLFKLGDKIKTKIKKIDSAANRVYLSI